MKTPGSRVPHCSYSIAIKRLTLLKRYHPTPVSLNELSKETEVSKGRHGPELSFLVRLGWVERPKKGLYQITERGLDLLDPKISDEQKKSLVRKDLNLLYKDELLGLFQLENYNRDKVINILKEGVGGNWQDYFAKKTLTRFLSFLRYAGYIEGKGKNLVLNFFPCPHCKVLINRGAKFCSECGNLTEKKKRMFCPKCSEKIKKEWKFCEHCGFNFLE